MTSRSDTPQPPSAEELLRLAAEPWTVKGKPQPSDEREVIETGIDLMLEAASGIVAALDRLACARCPGCAERDSEIEELRRRIREIAGVSAV